MSFKSLDRFNTIENASTIEIYFLNQCYDLDKVEPKVNLSLADTDPKNRVLPIIENVEIQLAYDDLQNHEYLYAFGIPEFVRNATALLLGKNNSALIENRAFGVQGIAGTGCLKLGAEFLHKIMKYKTVYLANPCWENYEIIFSMVGFKDIRFYRYWCGKTKSIDMPGLLQDLGQAPADSIVLLQACAHTPSGCDPTKEQWKKILRVIKERKLFPFFDIPFLGLASGNLDEDAWAIRLFIEKKFEIFCSQSFAKSFGLHKQGVGNLVIVVNNSSTIPAISSHLTLIIRSLYSSPPNHGARIISFVLNNPNLYEELCASIKMICADIKTMRLALYQELKKLDTPGLWEHITKQVGVFSYIGLNTEQIVYLRENYHVYMFKNGCFNLSGLNEKNVKYVAKAIHETVLTIPG